MECRTSAENANRRTDRAEGRDMAKRCPFYRPEEKRFIAITMKESAHQKTDNVSRRYE